MRSARTLLLLPLLASLAPAAALGEEREVVLFRPASGRFVLDDRRLVDAIRLYTADAPWRGAPAGGSSPRLSVWYEGVRRKGRVAVTLYVLPPGEEQRGPVVVRLGGRPGDTFYRAMALKVRAAVVGDPSLARVDAPPARMVQARVGGGGAAALDPGAGDRPPSVPGPARPPAPPEGGPPGGAASPPPAPARMAEAAAAPAAIVAPPAPSLSPVAAPPRPPPPAAPPAPPRAEPPGLPPPAPAAPLVVAAAPAATVAVAPTPAPVARADGAIAARAPPARRRVGVLLEAAGHFALSDQAARTRLGGAFDVALTIAPLVEVTLGFSADQRYSVSEEGRTSSLAIWPVEAGLRLVLHRNRWTFGGGPRGGVAILDAQAAKPTASARQIEVVGLAGAELIGRLRVASWLHVLAGLSLDVLLTQVRFEIPGSISVGTGRVMAGAVLGLAVSLP